MINRHHLVLEDIPGNLNQKNIVSYLLHLRLVYLTHVPCQPLLRRTAKAAQSLYIIWRSNL